MSTLIQSENRKRYSRVETAMMALQDHSLYDDHNRFDKPAPAVSGDNMFLSLKDEKRHALLTTPDVSVFALSTPEVQKMLTSSASITTTSSMIGTPTPSGLPMMRHPAPVTMEQEMYAAGFLERLEALHDTYDGRSKEVSTQSTYSTESSLEAAAPTYVTATFVDRLPNFATQTIPEPTASYSVDSSSDYYTSSGYGMPAYRHEAAAMMPSTGYTVIAGNHAGNSSVYHGGVMNHQKGSMLHEIAPIPDMKTQEQMKTERKKARNRIAASKCRLRRLQRESDLTSKVKQLKDHNKDLNDEVNGLKEQIANLKSALVQHMKTGCKVSVPPNFASSSGV